MMSELEKFKLVNSCETAEELSDAIIKLSDPATGLIQGRTREFDAKQMAGRVSQVIAGDVYSTVLTREFGIRQQAIYIKYARRI
jgi:hypothetical protein